MARESEEKMFPLKLKLYCICLFIATLHVRSFLISSVKLKREDRYTYSRLQSYLVARGTEILEHGSQAATTVARQTATLLEAIFFNFQDDFSKTTVLLLAACSTLS
jgi:hypothetical protein